MGKKYIIELEDEPFEQAGKKLWKSKKFNSLVFDEGGLNRLEEYKEPETKEKEEWPGVGDVYHCVTGSGAVIIDTWADAKCDHSSMAIGNIFRTREEAEFAVEKLKVIHELKKLAEPKDTKWDGRPHFYFYCNTYDKSICVNSVTTFKICDIYFAFESDARKAIAAVGEDRIKKYYLEVET